MKQKKPIYLHYSFLIPVIIAICLIAVALSLVIIYSDTEKNSNIIQNAISLSTLIVTGITLVFLYLTLNQQQEQINDNKSNVEFNRVLDITFKQVEFIKINLSTTHFTETYQKLYISLIVENYMINKRILEDITFRLDSNILFESLEKELKIFTPLILENKILSLEQKVLLGKIIGNNILERFESTISKFIILNEQFMLTRDFLECNEEGQHYRKENLKIAKDIYNLINPTKPI